MTRCPVCHVKFPKDVARPCLVCRKRRSCPACRSCAECWEAAEKKRAARALVDLDTLPR